MTLYRPLRMDGNDDPSFEYTVPINPNVDQLEAAGFYPQNTTSTDANAGIERDSAGNLILKDVHAGPKTLSSLGGSSNHTGTAIVNFGSHENTEQFSTTITAPWITATSSLSINILPYPPDHPVNDDDVWVEKLQAYLVNIVPGVSFDIVVIPDTTTWGRYTITYES